MLLGHLVHLKAKAGGDNSMPEKRGALEGAEGVVPQDSPGLTHQNSPGFEPVHSADSRFSTLREAGVCGYSSLYYSFPI